MVGTIITISHTFGAKRTVLCVAESGVGIPCMLKTPGQIAYEAFYKTSYGLWLIAEVQLPPFQSQSPEVQEAWEQSALAVLNMKGE
jgi:hypothetical protein